MLVTLALAHLTFFFFSFFIVLKAMFLLYSTQSTLRRHNVRVNKRERIFTWLIFILEKFHLETSFKIRANFQVSLETNRIDNRTPHRRWASPLPWLGFVSTSVVVPVKFILKQLSVIDGNGGCYRLVQPQAPHSHQAASPPREGGTPRSSFILKCN